MSQLSTEQLKRIADALESIAKSLEKLAFPPMMFIGGTSTEFDATPGKITSTTTITESPPLVLDEEDLA